MVAAPTSLTVKCTATGGAIGGRLIPVVELVATVWGKLRIGVEGSGFRVQIVKDHVEDVRGSTLAEASFAAGARHGVNDCWAA